MFVGLEALIRGPTAAKMQEQQTAPRVDVVTALTRPLYDLALHHLAQQRQPRDDAFSPSDEMVKKEHSLCEAVVLTDIAPYVGNARAREVIHVLAPTVHGMASIIASIRRRYLDETPWILRSIMSSIAFVAVTRSDPPAPHELVALVEKIHPHGQQHSDARAHVGPEPKRHKPVAQLGMDEPDEPTRADSPEKHAQLRRKETPRASTAEGRSHLHNTQKACIEFIRTTNDTRPLINHLITSQD